MIRAALNRPLVVALLYLICTIGMTWPVVTGVSRDLPGDLGDPAFVAGVMAWGAEHWLSLLGGDLGAAARFWDAPIFAPEPLATAYSEHFALHSLLTLPAYALTRNSVLCYNLWFLSTFGLCGLGTYLLLRELTGNPVAAFVGGLAFAFAPYRVAAMPHLQVLSSQWMPFVLYALRRYFTSGSSDPLPGAGAALWAQNLSSGYYMLFFGPFVALYALVEVATRGLWRSWRVWRDLIVTGAVAAIATLPFAMPYLIRQRGTRRPMHEVVWYSADLAGWLTASPLMNVWGWLQTFVKAEGLLFPGLTVVVLALVGAVTAWRTGGRTTDERQRARALAMFGTLALILSVWLSLGPQIQLETQPVGFPSLYRAAWEYLPGFSSARVPARFATITVLALAVLAGAGVAALTGPNRLWPAILCAGLVLAEGSAAPLHVNGTWSSAPDEVVPPESRLYRLEDAPPVYRYLRQLDARTVIAHFPFGLPEREIQYGYYAALHGRRTINGYSGAFPPSYGMRVSALRYPLGDPAAVADILDLDRVTHIVVHDAAWTRGDRGPLLREMLERSGGWRQVARFDRDYVLERAQK